MTETGEAETQETETQLIQAQVSQDSEEEEPSSKKRKAVKKVLLTMSRMISWTSQHLQQGKKECCDLMGVSGESHKLIHIIVDQQLISNSNV